MNLESFLELKVHEVAALVDDHGPRVVVCPVNGTRRWFALEGDSEARAQDFLPVILARYRDLIALFYAHGVRILLTPILGPDIVARGDGYVRMVLAALGEITSGPEFLDFYVHWDSAVRFYGDYRPYFEQTAPQTLPGFKRLEDLTRLHSGRRLYWGMFAQDPVEWIAREALAFASENGRAPMRAELVMRYYGADLPSADLYIGMQPAVAFDYPLLDTGRTALYFTTAPTPYLDEVILRRILHDYMFLRPIREEYDRVPVGEWDFINGFYQTHRRDVSGVGRLSPDGHFWLPDPEGPRRNAL